MFQSRTLRLTFGLVVGILAASIAGCGDQRINKANYEKLAKGMTLKEVEAILGPGTKQSQGDGSGMGLQVGVDVTMGGQSSTRRTDTYEWESGARKITVFMDASGKVAEIHSKGL